MAGRSLDRRAVGTRATMDNHITTSDRFDLAIADACRTAQVPHDAFTATVRAGAYPCLPGVDPGSPRVFDDTDLTALYIYGRLLDFGFGALRAGEYACRAHEALKSNACARAISIALTSDGGKRLVVEHDTPLSPAALPERIQFDVGAIRQFLKRPFAQDAAQPA